jgi:PAS domain S-box-containing protein
MKAGAPYTFIAEGKKGAQKVTAILVPIENTPLSVVTFFPPNEQYGGGSPLKLLYTTGVVALFIFAGMIFFVRLNTSKAILLTRLDETILRERTVDEKNLQLSHEIAERKLAEAELREEHAFRKAIESSTLAGITATDLEGRQIYVNPAFCNMIGWSAEKLIDASPPFVYWPEEERDKLTHALRMAIEGTPLPEGGIDSVFLHHDGSRINVRILLSPLKGETEPCSGCLTSVYDVTERTRMEEHIRASLTEKEVLLKEIHHRVKNNMQVISSLLSLQSKYILDQEMRDLFRESQERVKSMALIHEKLYRSGNLAQIDFGEYVQTLSSSLVRTYAIRAEKVNVKVAVSKIFFGVDTAIPCGLIINELVSNALKHAFPGGRRGTILISLHVDDQGCNTLVVSDDGIGFPEGLDFRHTASLGMKLVNMLTGQLSGTIELICSRGTEFRIVFPADPVR